MMYNTLVKKFFLTLKQEGAFSAVQKVARRFTTDGLIQKRRVALSLQISHLFDGTVRYGAFRGLKLTTDCWWSLSERASILLGLYEKEVLESLSHIPPHYTDFIDLGAADGYYGIGVLVNGMFKKSYCYEISEMGQETIRQNAILNNVTDRVTVRGIAKGDFYQDFDTESLSKTVLFVDIEGAEFDLFTAQTFKSFDKSIIFMELHHWFFTDGDAKLQKLKDDAQATHKITEITTAARDLSVFPELDHFSDTNRWLICSEGRGRRMTWLRFDPKD